MNDVIHLGIFAAMTALAFLYVRLTIGGRSPASSQVLSQRPTERAVMPSAHSDRTSSRRGHDRPPRAVVNCSVAEVSIEERHTAAAMAAALGRLLGPTDR
jgi:hypothetical protein